MEFLMADEDFDWYTANANIAFEQLNATAAQIKANLAQAKATGDAEETQKGIRQLAYVEREMNDLQNLNARHEQSKVRYTPPPLSAEEKRAKPIEKCTWEDAYEWASKSKHGVDAEAFRRGMEEVMRNPTKR